MTDYSSCVFGSEAVRTWTCTPTHFSYVLVLKITEFDTLTCSGLISRSNAF
jgi:hypothetical protein